MSSIVIDVEKCLNPNISEFWFDGDGEIRASRYRVLYGGRGSSKSHELCTMLILLSIAHRKRIVCARAFQVKISDSVKSLLEEKIHTLGLSKYFIIQKTSIECVVTGSYFTFHGIERNTAEFKGIEGIDICYLEEAQGVTKEIFDIVTPTVRKQNSEIWIAFNPQNYFDFIYQEFVVKEKANATVKKINYTDNPFLSQTMLTDIESYREDDDFNHVYLGEPKDSASKSIIKLSWLQSAIDAHAFLNVDPSSKNYLGFDVMDDGDDFHALALNLGGELTEIEEWKTEQHEQDIAVQKVVRKAHPHGATIIYDSIGVGAGVGAFLRQHRTARRVKEFYGFKAGSSPSNPNGFYSPLGLATQQKNKDVFLNIKSQKWHEFAEKLKITHNAVTNGSSYRQQDIISISSKIKQKLLDKLFKELTAPNSETVNEKQLKVESKASLAKRGIPSHNLADAVIMAYANKKKIF